MNSLRLLEYLNLFATFSAILIGVKSLKTLTENRILIFIPILSLLQIILSEFLGINHPKNEVSTTTLNLINIYICAEFLLICLYFWKLSKIRRHKAFILISIPIIIISIFISNHNLHQKSLFELDIFLLIEGPIILILALLLTSELIKKKNIKDFNTNSNLIATLGIMFSFFISWPTIIVQNSIRNYSSPLFRFSYIFNSIAYLIFFSFLSYSFYVARKSRII
jgi:hypothetical protein